MTKRSLSSIGLVAIAMVALALTGGRGRIKDTSKLVIYVVGDGVGHPTTIRPGGVETSTDSAQGKALWTGVQTALTAHDLPAIKDVVEIVPLDDAGRKEAATEHADRICKDPRTLAVIGHSTSGTTRSTLEKYQAYGIPVIMPIATSPLVWYGEGSGDAETTRARTVENALRLPPGDTVAQAPAIARVILNDLKAEECYLVIDDTTDAQDYSKPLSKRVGKLLESVLRNTYRLRRGEADGHMDLARILRERLADTIVFCGYSTCADDFITALRIQYPDPGTDRPRIVMSDGCFEAQAFDLSGFDIRVLFPVAPIKSYKNERSADADRAQKEFLAARGDALPSYEIYGYDAIQILARAIEALRPHGIDRRGVLDFVQTLESHDGLVHTYEFRHMEDSKVEYCVYRTPPSGTESKTQLVLQRHIPTRELKLRK